MGRLITWLKRVNGDADDHIMNGAGAAEQVAGIVVWVATGVVLIGLTFPCVVGRCVIRFFRTIRTILKEG